MGRRTALLLTTALIAISSVEGASELRRYKSVEEQRAAEERELQGHYIFGNRAMQTGKWYEGSQHFRFLTVHYPNTSQGEDSQYFLGVCYFNMLELEEANNAFTAYLKGPNSGDYFDEAIRYKFRIAELLAEGCKRRCFGFRHMPKWVTGYDLALDIFEEVITALPNQEIAAQSLYTKGYLLWSMKDFRGAVEAYQTLIKRFPKHELAVESYLLIAKVYLCQCFCEFQNPDLISFAELNVRRFRKDFPLEERIAEAEQDVMDIKEVYARGLYGTGRFYERKKKPCASVLYYQNVILLFPETCTAALAQNRLSCICPEALNMSCFRAADEIDVLEADLSETSDIDFDDGV